MLPGNSQRLNKYLALALGISRREADLLIEKGSVCVNGVTAQLGLQVNSSDHITVNNKEIPLAPTKYTYLLLNKPAGYVCSRRSQGDTPTIYDLLPLPLKHLKSVGRLDKDSSGLIIFTNDGDFAHRMTHPQYRKTKVYRIRLDRDLEPLHQQIISDIGITLDDGRSQLTLAKLRDGNLREWQVTMSEGRNRQIRRTFAALGYTVVRLDRTNFGNYSLGDIKRGLYHQINIQ